MSEVTVRGATGAVKWSYHEAASLSSWAVTSVEGVRTLSATLIKSDAFRVSQRPLRFVATRDDVSWAWPIQELQIQGASLTATLGPPER